MRTEIKVGDEVCFHDPKNKRKRCGHVTEIKDYQYMIDGLYPIDKDKVKLSSDWTLEDNKLGMSDWFDYREKDENNQGK